MNFEEEIRSLIDSHCEGSYWDFKIQWPTTEGGSLLHDIICMANNLEHRDAYIIIGVKDETCEIEGIKPDDKDRKNTQMLNTYLKDKPFAGNIRPLTEVKEINLNQKTVDVIVIKRSTNTPFYLTCSKGDYKNLLPYHIYTRIQDSNTDKTGSADLDKTESLWKKRFGIDLPATDRFKVLIKEKDKWKKSPFLPEFKPYSEIWYHEIFPEFTIKISDDESGKAQELYMAECLDPTPLWFNICICYHNTILDFFKGVGLDGGRTTIIAPHCYVSMRAENQYHLIFHYYINNSPEIFLSKILGGFSKNSDCKIPDRLPVNSIIVFGDSKQFEEFKKRFLEQDHTSKLTEEDMQEIRNIQPNTFYISPEVENHEMMQLHAKFTKWTKNKLEQLKINNLSNSQAHSPQQNCTAP